MKKFVVKLALVMVVVSVLFSVSSCGDEMKKHTVADLSFSLPKNMKQRKMQDEGTIWYGDNKNIAENPESLIYYYTNDTLLEELYLNKATTASEYAEWFINVNEYYKKEKVEEIESSVSEDGSKITQKYIDKDENTFYFDYIIRNKAVLVHVTMCCNAPYREKYEPIFTEWMDYIRLAG